MSMLKFLRCFPTRVLHGLVQLRHQRAYQQQVFSHLNERAIEYRFALEAVSSEPAREILEVGPGGSAFPALLRTCGYLVTAIDPKGSYWSGDFENWSYYIATSAVEKFSEGRRFDCVCCISTLEHIDEFDAAVARMAAMLLPQGRLVLTFPFSNESYIPNVYDLPGSCAPRGLTYTTRAFTRSQIDGWAEKFGLSLGKIEYWRCFSGQFWSQGERLAKPLPLSGPDGAQLICLSAVKS